MTDQSIPDDDWEEFEAAYTKDEKEILVVTSDFYAAGGAPRPGKPTLRSAFREFLAYVDLATGEVRPGKGRIEWPISEEEWNEKSWHRLDSETIYRLRVRELIDKTVPEGRIPSFSNRFLLVSVLEEGVENSDLQAILSAYREPVSITNEVGEFTLNKDLGLFDGSVEWMGNLSLFRLMWTLMIRTHGTKPLKLCVLSSGNRSIGTRCSEPSPGIA